jgi:antitoxin (DNA-binding transcriptional repressor) of toxin-antitoxin stability system
MKAVSVRELRALLSRLDDVLAKVGEVTVTRHGTAIARILPVASAGRKLPSHRDFLAKQRLLPTGSETLVRAERDERG